jgi:phosphoribosylpyrophosphate synthetase
VETAANSYVIATHGVLSEEAAIQIENSCIHQVVVTNTVPQAGSIDFASISLRFPCL